MLEKYMSAPGLLAKNQERGGGLGSSKKSRI